MDFPQLRLSLPMCFASLVLLIGCKDEPAPSSESSPKIETAPLPQVNASPRSEDTGPMALVHQKVERPYRDIPMLGLDGRPTPLGKIATAPVVFVVPWFTLHGVSALHFAAQVQELLADEPRAQVFVTSADRAIKAEDREVLQTLIREAGVEVPVWVDPELKLLAVINASNTGERPAGNNALWVAPLTAFSGGLEAVEPSFWDTDDLRALKKKLLSQVEQLATQRADVAPTAH